MQRLQAAPLSRSAPCCNYNIPFLSNQTNNTTLVWQEATKPGFLFVCYPTLIASPHPAPARFLQQQHGEVLTPQQELRTLLTPYLLTLITSCRVQCSCAKSCCWIPTIPMFWYKYLISMCVILSIEFRPWLLNIKVRRKLRSGSSQG